MASGDGYQLSERAVRRTAEAVRRIEGMSEGGASRLGARRHVPHQQLWYRIVSNDSGGEYTLRRQKWGDSSGAFADVTDADNIEYNLAVTGYDVRGRSDGAADAIVQGWKVCVDGEWITLVDVSSAVVGFPVKVTKTSGGAGSDSTLCTFVYTVKSLDGDQIATGKAPKLWRNANTMYEMEPPADDAIGLAYYDEDGALQLFCANEVPVIEGGGGSGTGGTDLTDRLFVADGASGGTSTISSADWRGKILLCLLQVVADDTPEDTQWGGGAISGITRYFGSSYNGSDVSLVYASGGWPAVVLEGGTGNLYWSWSDNNYGYDVHGVCRIFASDAI